MLHNIKKVFLNFFSLDIRSLALFRILLSSFIISDLIVRATDLTTFYTDQGTLPRSALDLIPGQFSLHMISGSPVFISLLFIVAGISAVLLLIGFHTRSNTIISWFLLISLQNRNPLILQGGDQILRLVLLWSIFLPLGEYYSIDSIRNLGKNAATKVLSGATFAYLVQICLIYFCTALLKTGTEWHKDGSALYFALHIEQYATPFTQYFLKLPTSVLQILTHVVISLEFFGSIILLFSGIFPLLRVLIIFAFLGLHAGIAISLSVGTIAWIPMISLVALLPAEFWDFIYYAVNCISKHSTTTLYYDGTCGFCQKAALAVKIFLFLDRTNITSGNENISIQQEIENKNSWVIVDQKGNHFYKAAAVVPLLQSSLFFWVFANFFKHKAIIHLGDKVYEIIAQHRKSVCTIPSSTRIHPSCINLVLQQIIPFLLIIYVIFYNLSYLPNSLISMPYIPFMFETTQAVRLDQYWNMFAPYPLKDDGWYVIPGTLTDGSQVDLFNHVKPVSYAKPPVISTTYKNARWAKYMMNLWNSSYAHNRLQLASYLCQQWNSSHGLRDQLKNLEVNFMLRYTPPMNTKNKTVVPQKISILQYTCP